MEKKQSIEPPKTSSERVFHHSRSLKHDLEVDVILREEASKSSLIRQFLYDLADSVQLEKRDILIRYGEKSYQLFFLNLIRYWL